MTKPVLFNQIAFSFRRIQLLLVFCFFVKTIKLKLKKDISLLLNYNNIKNRKKMGVEHSSGS